MLKKCNECGKEKKIECFVKDKNKKDGYRGMCKECLNRRLRKTPVKQKPKDGYKYCTDCGRELSLDNFNMRFIYGKNRPFSYCKACEHIRNNNRYDHVCSACGKVYKSGRKNSHICKDCKARTFSEIGKANLQKLNANQFGENNRMYGVHRFGLDNPNYNFNKTDEERETGRSIEGYGIFIREVYKRDDYTCQYCGERSGDLNAHHLNSYDWYKEGRTDTSNGVTLCSKCHRLFHLTYGFGNNTKRQFYKFINSKKNESAYV
jgi:hypothetical protein